MFIRRDVESLYSHVLTDSTTIGLFLGNGILFSYGISFELDRLSSCSFSRTFTELNWNSTECVAASDSQRNSRTDIKQNYVQKGI